MKEGDGNVKNFKQGFERAEVREKIKGTDDILEYKNKRGYTCWKFTIGLISYF
jgi:hypothetical protein